MKAIALMLAAVMCGCVLAADPETRILTYEQYAEIKHGRPYILEFELGYGALLLYGAGHTYDASDPIVSDIIAEWERFDPTVAYNEGGNPPTLVTAKRAVERAGEPGLVRFLAGKHRVPVATFEPLESDQDAALLEMYTREQVKVFSALLSYLTWRKTKRTGTDEEFMNSVLSRNSGVQGPPSDIKELEVTYRRLFPREADWKNVKDEWFDPLQSHHYTNVVQADLGVFRDRHILRLLTARALNGDRVFAVIGASHVPMLEPAVIAILGNPVRKRDGGESAAEAFLK